MLPPFIIDQIREREERERTREERPVVHLPIPSRREDEGPVPEEPSDRGVTIIDLFG